MMTIYNGWYSGYRHGFNIYIFFLSCFYFLFRYFQMNFVYFKRYLPLPNHCYWFISIVIYLFLLIFNFVIFSDLFYKCHAILHFCNCCKYFQLRFQMCIKLSQVKYCWILLKICCPCFLTIHIILNIIIIS